MSLLPNSFVTVVIGGGHAGVEAAAAAAARGGRVLLVTPRVASIGALACNPSIGGVGKGHLVRELDALGGVMARAADAAALHYRLLNRRKGAAVRGPRVQVERALYPAAVRARLPRTLELVEAAVRDVDFTARRVALEPDGARLPRYDALVVTTGTLLGGLVRYGRYAQALAPVAAPLRARLRAELNVRRFKTGTPPRLAADSIDYGKLEEQASERGWRMSAKEVGPERPLISCWLTRTNERTHALVQEAAAADYVDETGAVSPRYCPSLEAKVARFREARSHQVWMEPEGGGVVYPSGLAMSMRAEAQARVVRSVRGLERARLLAPGYYVEYDYVDARQLTRTLQWRGREEVRFAGQICGSTGYEEAAAQGWVAGAQRELERAHWYMGVLVDDLTRRGVSEPYRMLSSRVERRQALSADIGERAAAAAAPLVARADREWRRTEAALGRRLRVDVDYYSARGAFSREVRERLAAARPATLGDAARLEGVTAAAVVSLMRYLE